MSFFARFADEVFSSPKRLKSPGIPSPCQDKEKLIITAYGLSSTGKGQNLDNMYINGRYINVQTETMSRIQKTENAPFQVYGVSDSEIGAEDDRSIGMMTGQIVMDMLQRTQNTLGGSGKIEKDRIWESVLEANKEIKDKRIELGRDVLGTSFAALFMHGNRGLAVHLGDSRIYVIRGGRMLQITDDHLESSDMFRLTASDNVRITELKTQIIREISFVPETMFASKLMKSLMQQKRSLAIVVDEFGGTSGLVSLEDIMEEITGEIEDEHDNKSHVAKQVAEGEYVLSARLEIEKVNEMFALELPESDEYMTIGGLILHEYQSFPKLNEVIRIKSYEFKILKNTATKIELVRLKVME